MYEAQQVKQLISVEDVVDMKNPTACIKTVVLVLKPQRAAWSGLSLSRISPGLFVRAIFGAMIALCMLAENW